MKFFAVSDFKTLINGFVLDLDNNARAFIYTEFRDQVRTNGLNQVTSS